MITALGDAVALVIAAAGRTTETVIAELHAARSDERDSVILLIGCDVPAIDRAMLRAAVASLAIEIAPAKRLNAVDILGQARDDDVTAAARYLASAESTTGQLIEVHG